MHVWPDTVLGVYLVTATASGFNRVDVSTAADEDLLSAVEEAANWVTRVLSNAEEFNELITEIDTDASLAETEAAPEVAEPTLSAADLVLRALGGGR